jgi:hypothetical protein
MLVSGAKQMSRHPTGSGTSQSAAHGAPAKIFSRSIRSVNIRVSYMYEHYGTDIRGKSVDLERIRRQARLRRERHPPTRMSRMRRRYGDGLPPQLQPEVEPQPSHT